MKINTQQGITLVELMISIVLGLLITAAAVQLFITGQISLNMQRGMADIQDNGNFGLNYIASDIRRANLGAAVAVSDDQTLYGGIVVTPANVGQYVTIANKLLSRSNGMTPETSGNSWTGASNVNTFKSDQLTISYQPEQNIVSPTDLKKTTLTPAEQTEYNTRVIGSDCEGNNITLNEVRQGVYIVQRYFLRKDTTQGSDQGLALACAASRYTQAAIDVLKAQDALVPKPTIIPITLTGLDGAGQIVLRRVEHFHILLGISDGDYDAPANLRYITINDYLAIVPAKRADGSDMPRPRIRSIQLGMLVRASDSVGSDSLVSDTPSFTILDQNVTVKTPAVNTSKYLRQVVSQTITLRNALGRDSR